MGAATILMASNLVLPKNVVGLIADSPYSSPKEIIKKVLSDMKLPSKLVYPFIYMSTLIYGRFNLESCDTLDCAINSKIPFLLIHGTKDTFVPCDMSKELSKSKNCYKALFIDGAEHGISYIIDPKSYEKAVKSFLKKVLKNR